MYEVIVTEDFINIVRELPLKYVSVLTRSFVSLRKLELSEVALREDNAFVLDLLEQIKNQELE